MKVRLEIDESLTEEDIIIRCKNINEDMKRIESMILDITKCTPLIIFYKDNKEYYLDLNDVLFFETSDYSIYSHTKDDIYLIKYRLYELENILPRNFMRISKGAIANVNQILSISSSFGSSYLVEFNKSHKQVYVSRRYIKFLKNGLGERRNKL